MTDRFSGKVALIAGGTGGLGRFVSAAFLEEGAQVVATHHNPSALEDLRQSAGANQGVRLDGYSVDFTNDADVRKMVESVVAKYGSLDVLVNAVGGYAAGSKLWETEPKIFDRMFSLNFYSGYLLTRNVVPAMLKQGRGAIVNVASMAAIDHAAASAAYAASKAAAVAMIDSLAADLKGTGIRANSILPSIIDTEANRKAMPAADFSKWPKPQDIARIILFLCSDDAKLIHGASIHV
jgi:NAD(P)-dependent dehydrogenase (short-subunit alcohol dehydrogenase family)